MTHENTGTHSIGGSIGRYPLSKKCENQFIDCLDYRRGKNDKIFFVIQLKKKRIAKILKIF